MVVWRILLGGMALALASLAVADDKPAGAVQPATAEPSADSGDPAKLQADRRRATPFRRSPNWETPRLRNPRGRATEKTRAVGDRCDWAFAGRRRGRQSGSHLPGDPRAGGHFRFRRRGHCSTPPRWAAPSNWPNRPNRSAAQRAQTILAPQDLQGVVGQHDSRRYRRWKRAIVRIQPLWAGSSNRWMPPAQNAKSPKFRRKKRPVSW